MHLLFKADRKDKTEYRRIDMMIADMSEASATMFRMTYQSSLKQRIIITILYKRKIYNLPTIFGIISSNLLILFVIILGNNFSIVL